MKKEVDTPSLCVDLHAMDRNLLRMSEYAKTKGVLLRPHAKMHKSAEIALYQIRYVYNVLSLSLFTSF